MSPVDVAALCRDLAEEHLALDRLVAGLDDEAWARPTPAAGWDVKDAISHLCYFDRTATLAVTDPDGFAAHTADARRGGADVQLGRSMGAGELLAAWRTSRSALLAAFAGADPSARVPWYGPSMSLASFVTARIMETWAHGQDVVDALDAEPVVSSRLRHVCHIGVTARPYAFIAHGAEDPGDPVRVEVAAPGGGTWAWGDEAAPDRVTGTALDLALVVTQRRHLADTDLVVEGPTARAWMAVAQAFAGPGGPGREPGMRRLAQGA